MEKNFIKRLQELAGITDESKMKSRIDQALEKTDIVYDGGIETGTEDYFEFMGEIYQVPFDYDEYDLEGFINLINKKEKELNFPISKVEDYLETKGIELV